MIERESILNSTSGEPLIAYTRGGFVEGLHRGSIAVVSSDGRLLASTGDAAARVVIRSCAKPFQLMTVLAAAADREFGFTDEELAVAAASHSAEPEHLRLVSAMLAKTGLSEESLRCGVHPPFSPHVAARMAREGEENSPLHNNCSGKHAAMLAACLAKGWSTADYESPDHPLQVENRRRTARFAGCDVGEVGVAIDGCTVPSFVLTLGQAALAYARLADPEAAPEGESQRAARVFGIMNAHPALGSGRTGRLEARLMELFPGRLAAKVGAEAFFTVGLAPGVLGERGAGLAVKLDEGITFNRAVDQTVIAALHQLGVLDDTHLDALADFYTPHVRNCRGEVVGDVEILFDLRRRGDDSP